MSSEIFGHRCVEKLKEAKRRDPNLAWERVAEIIQNEFALLPFDRRPRLSPKELQGALFDALTRAVGLTPPLGPSARAAVGTALADIRSATPNVTPEEVARRAKLYRTRHATWPLTAHSLAKYWSEFPPPAPKTEPYPEPANWRQEFATAFPNYDLPETHLISNEPYQWRDLPTDMRAEITRKCNAR